MILNLIGNKGGATGYSVHTTKLAEALEKQCDLKMKDFDKEHILTAIVTPDVWPLFWNKRFKAFCPFGVFEGDKVSTGWAINANSDKVKLIFTPSEHSKQAFVNAGVPADKLKIVPHGVDPELFNPDAKPNEQLANKDVFTFLYVGGWADGVNDRKGLDLALIAFNEEFSKDEKVRFVAKINTSYAPEQKIANDIAKLELKKERALIITAYNVMPYDKLPGLYTASDCFVMPTKADAFCMPCLEAGACGLPVIANSYGGQGEYLANGNNYLIDDGELKPATGRPKHYYEEANWFTPNIKALRKQMRYVFNHQKEAKEKGLKNSEDFRKNMTWDESARKLLNHIKTII